jgi:hypothetical protein
VAGGEQLGHQPSADVARGARDEGNSHVVNPGVMGGEPGNSPRRIRSDRWSPASPPNAKSEQWRRTEISAETDDLVQIVLG